MTGRSRFEVGEAAAKRRAGGGRLRGEGGANRGGEGREPGPDDGAFGRESARLVMVVVIMTRCQVRRLFGRGEVDDVDLDKAVGVAGAVDGDAAGLLVAAADVVLEIGLWLGERVNCLFYESWKFFFISFIFFLKASSLRREAIDMPFLFLSVLTYLWRIPSANQRSERERRWAGR